MKKLISLAFCATLLAAPISIANPIPSQLPAEMPASGSRTVKATGYSTGRVKLKNTCQVEVFFNSYGEPVTVKKGNNTYNVRPSDRQGYDYCFYADNFIFYFNL